MKHDDHMHRSEDLNTAGDQMGAAGDHTGEAAHHLKEAGRHTGEALKSGASSAAGAVKSGASSAAGAAGAAAGAVKSGASTAAGAVGSAVSAAASRIAEKTGGWWSSAKDAMPELPEIELEACRGRYDSYQAAGDEFTMDVALAAYALGYAAAQNPSYEGTTYDSVEPDLRHGYASEQASYDAWRDFSRYGYERGAGGL